MNPHTRSLCVRLLYPAIYIGAATVLAATDVRDQKPVKMEEVVVDASKTHTLFMGADISVNLDRDLYPVRDVVGSSWVIDINGKDKLISSKEAPTNLKITPTLKLTEVAATITGFVREAAYSYANDPSVRLTKGLTQAGLTDAMLTGVALDAQHLADTASNKALGPSAIFASSDQQFGANAQMLTAQTTPAIAHPGKPIPGSTTAPVSGATDRLLNDGQQLFIDQANTAAAVSQANLTTASEPTGRIVTQGLDAMDVAFDISSARPLYNPYVVTMTRFRTPNSKPGVVQSLVYARALDPIDSRRTHVHFSEDGFPFNYELVDFQLHIYNRGIEIATNLANNRVELTRDEAFEYIKMEYVGAHKNETLPALPAMGKLPAELPNRLAAGKYSETFFVKVSKDGLAKESYVDVACQKRIDDAFLDEVVKSIRFKPALANGTPVEGVAALNLRKLQI